MVNRLARDKDSTYWAHWEVTKKMKCFEYTPRYFLPGQRAFFARRAIPFAELGWIHFRFQGIITLPCDALTCYHKIRNLLNFSLCKNLCLSNVLLSREPLLKGKIQYSWPPRANKFRPVTFDNANTIYFFTTQGTLMRRSTVTYEPSLLVSAPCFKIGLRGERDN
jgi:hypothetical protein